MTGLGRLVAVVDPSEAVKTARVVFRPLLDGLDEAAQEACSDGTLGASGTEDANSIERSSARKEVGSGGGLTFGEGMARLSVAFSIYAVFLAGLFTFRQFYHRHYLTPPGGTAGPGHAGMAELPPDPRSDR